MKRSGGVEVDPAYDAHVNGTPTPGTHTDVVEVPKDEIERPDGKVQKGSEVVETTEDTEIQANWRRAYELAVEGKTWDQIAEIMDIKKNQSWMFVGKHCSRLGIENPTKKKKGKAKPAPKKEPVAKPAPKPEPVKEPEPTSEPEVLKPIATSSTEILQEGDKGFEKTSKDHTHTAIVNRFNRTFRLCFGAKPRDRDIERAIRNEMSAS
jgi:hypothetical protein